ncbi:hypothetical protein HYH03_004706 [Edaphochlamys debaryana]|uniref:Peptidase M20 dimerisation domain-containing protein n=1 Tax=Edaphochlamys debaryana TaxID=47281 RepID=A0A835Y6I5_9CHLO|nr:hypothetical protein HYH03_004706 [Edaphochlamys debaryana]|eukprot:KAG2497115.1 hypothetical protein HYH03_004706 [Edaphochlamys debaryana]
MEDAGMAAHVDAVGNVHGTIASAAPGARAVLMGSHYDTVLDGGAYDGALGILVAIAAVKGALLRALAGGAGGGLAALGPQPDEEAGDVSIPPALAASLLTRGSLHVVAFADEEGVRFGSTFLGSRAVAGTLLSYHMLGSKDTRTGATLEEVLREENGVADPPSAVAALALDPTTVSEYVEVHIEQGPVLEARALPLGVVSGIAGQTRLLVHVNGTQGHAGTVPMAGRRDALAAAAALVYTLEWLCSRSPDNGGAPEEDNLVCTVGDLRVWPGASNVIAGYTRLSVDIRSKTDDVRERVVEEVVAAVTAECERRGVACEVERKHDAAAVLCDQGVMAGLQAAAKEAEALVGQVLTKEELAAAGPLEQGLRQTPVLVSGAGHDAMAIAEAVPKMGMMFVRCRGGVSHSPLEHVEPYDVTASTAALASYLQERAVGSTGAVHDEL